MRVFLQAVAAGIEQIIGRRSNHNVDALIGQGSHDFQAIAVNNLVKVAEIFPSNSIISVEIFNTRLEDMLIFVAVNVFADVDADSLGMPHLPKNAPARVRDAFNRPS